MVGKGEGTVVPYQLIAVTLRSPLLLFTDPLAPRLLLLDDQVFDRSRESQFEKCVDDYHLECLALVVIIFSWFEPQFCKLRLIDTLLLAVVVTVTANSNGQVLQAYVNILTVKTGDSRVLDS